MIYYGDAYELNIFYAKRRGVYHKTEGICCQDNFKVKKFNFGVVMVAADGLGSKKHAEVGSRAVCEAVCDAVGNQTKENINKVKLLTDIKERWLLGIQGYAATDCSTTCLFAFFCNNGKLLIGQLGDGLICIRVGTSFTKNAPEKEFSNMTHSICEENYLKHWKLQEYSLNKNNFSIALMTDGVSEDILEGKEESFLDYLLSKKHELSHQLEVFESPYYDDDKTVILCEGVRKHEKQVYRG